MTCTWLQLDTAGYSWFQLVTATAGIPSSGEHNVGEGCEAGQLVQHVLAVLVHVDVVEVLGPVDLPQQPPHLSECFPGGHSGFSVLELIILTANQFSHQHLTRQSKN